MTVVPTCVLAGHALAANWACVHSGRGRHRADLAGRQVDDEALEVARGLVDVEVQREVRVGAGLRVGGRGGDAGRREGGAAGASEGEGGDQRRAESGLLSTAAMCQIRSRRAPGGGGIALRAASCITWMQIAARRA